MDPSNQMRVGALLALSTLVIPILAAVLAGALSAAGYAPDVLAPAFGLLVPVMYLVFVSGVVLAAAGFIRRGRLAGI